MKADSDVKNVLTEDEQKTYYAEMQDTYKVP